ncbi:hypothetical protein GPOL_174p00360 (plasmid) [Gordonia polyisoprenivorans VH2]|uniref:Uncharacterized protein n=1 Tax=Gordonia polyisoprenivorans (strain DSM 44266 / VH2) TaxID=1112204 RepID=H6N512_GORPV|nr:hypothetical protein GPOL_174p00360 [Gordonia polyisoprenivorans VH2]
MCALSLPISRPRGSRWAAAVRRPSGGIFVGESLGADLTQSTPHHFVESRSWIIGQNSVQPLEKHSLRDSERHEESSHSPVLP